MKLYSAKSGLLSPKRCGWIDIMDHKKLAALVPDIDLRWVLRDIRARRSTILPPKPEHLEELMGRGWVEMRSGKPICTEAGLDAMDVY